MSEDKLFENLLARNVLQVPPLEPDRVRLNPEYVECMKSVRNVVIDNLSEEATQEDIVTDLAAIGYLKWKPGGTIDEVSDACLAVKAVIDDFEDTRLEEWAMRLRLRGRR